MNKFKHFMTTLGEKMSDREVDEILQSMKKDKDHSEYLEYKGMPKLVLTSRAKISDVSAIMQENNIFAWDRNSYL